MTQAKLDIAIKEILDKANIKIHKIRQYYVEENAEHQVGDFIRNLTGIIKIESIKYIVTTEGLDTVYCGYKYKTVKGILSRTLAQEQICLSSNAIKVDNPIVE